MNRLFFSVWVSCLLWLVALPVWAQAGSIDVSLEPTRVFVGEPIHLQINMQLGGSLEDLQVPTLDGLEVVSGQWPPIRPQVFIQGGTFRVPIADVYLTATKPGKLRFGAVKARVNGSVIESTPIEVEALEKPSTPSSGPSDATRNTDPLWGLPDSPSDVLVVHAVADRDEVYLGDAVIATYWLLMKPGVRMGQLQVEPPEVSGALSRILVPFEQQNLSSQQVLWGGQVYAAFRLGKMSFRPLQEGPLSIPPAIFRAVTRGGFGDIIERPSETLRVNVLPLPTEGRPESDLSLVGTFSLNATVGVDKARTGEAFPVTIVISGVGELSSVETLPLPTLAGAKVRPPSIQRDDSVAGEEVISRLEAQYFVVPEKPGELEIALPKIAVFRPNDKTWSLLEKPSLKVKVEGPARLTGDVLPLRQAREHLDGIVQSPVSGNMLGLLLFAPGLLVAGWLWTERKKQQKQKREALLQKVYEAQKTFVSAASPQDAYKAFVMLAYAVGERVLGRECQDLSLDALGRRLMQALPDSAALKRQLARSEAVRFGKASSGEEERNELAALVSILVATAEKHT